MGMERDDKRWAAASRAQCSDSKLRFVARVSGKLKFVETDANGVQALGIVQAHETVPNSAFNGKLRRDGGDVAARPLNAARGKHFRE